MDNLDFQLLPFRRYRASRITAVQALHVNLTLAYRPFTAAYSNASLVPLLASSIDCFCNVKAQTCKESRFLDRGQMASGDTFRTDRRTHNSKLSIMIHAQVIEGGWRHG